MKQMIFMSMLFVLLGCGRAESGGSVIYAQFVTHNERSPHEECDPVTTTEQAFLGNRALLLEFANTIVQHGGALDVQSDYQFVEAVQQWDSGAGTGGKNILRYLAEIAPAQVVVEAHGHVETGPNYADIAYMLSQVGVSPNGVVGGFVTDPAYGLDWSRYDYPVYGNSYPNYSWSASILWGSPEWQSEEQYTPSGIWRPTAGGSFYAHDPSQKLVFVGRYWKTVAGLADLISKARAGQLPAGMYTVSIYTRQCSLTHDVVVATGALIDQYAGDVAAGRLVWATVPDAVKIWRVQWGGKPFMYRQ